MFDMPREDLGVMGTARGRSASAAACDSSSIGSGLGGASSGGGGGAGGGGGGSGSGGAGSVGGGVVFEEDDSAGAVCELREDVGSVEEVILTHNAFIRKVASEAGIR